MEQPQLNEHTPVEISSAQTAELGSLSTLREHYPLIDYVWVFSVFFVIWFHTPPRFEPQVDRVVWYLCVGLFFVVSGILFNPQRYTLKSFLQKTAERLVWPAMLCYIAFYVLWLVFGRYHAGVEDLEARWFDPLIEMVTGNPKLVAAPLWFIVALVVIRCVTYALCQLKSVAILILASLAIAALSPYLSNVFFCLRYASIFFVCHTAGMLFQMFLLKRICSVGAPIPLIREMKEVGVIILAFQNYIIGCLKIGFSHFDVDLLSAPPYMKYVVSAIAIVLTVGSALLANKICPIITKPSLLKRWNKK